MYLRRVQPHKRAGLGSVQWCAKAFGIQNYPRLRTSLATTIEEVERSGATRIDQKAKRDACHESAEDARPAR